MIMLSKSNIIDSQSLISIEVCEGVKYDTFLIVLISNKFAHCTHINSYVRVYGKYVPTISCTLITAYILYNVIKTPDTDITIYEVSINLHTSMLCRACGAADDLDISSWDDIVHALIKVFIVKKSINRSLYFIPIIEQKYQCECLLPYN